MGLVVVREWIWLEPRPRVTHKHPYMKQGLPVSQARFLFHSADRFQYRRCRTERVWLARLRNLVSRARLSREGERGTQSREMRFTAI